MALEQSILKSTKKKLNLDESYHDFDQDVIDYINSSFFRLYQLGLGPSEGFAIDDEEETWDSFITGDLNVSVLNAVKTYVGLKVRLQFDPPGLAHHINAIEEQIVELEHTLLTERDLAVWTPTVSSSSHYLP